MACTGDFNQDYSSDFLTECAAVETECSSVTGSSDIYLFKHDFERVQFAIDFENLMVGDEAITGFCSHSAPVGLGLESGEVVGSTVQYWVSSGSADTTYSIGIKSETDEGQILVGAVLLKVI